MFIYLRVFFLVMFCFNLLGCKSIREYHKLMALKHLGDSRNEISDYVQAQEDSFYKLIDDFKNGLIIKGFTKSEFIDRYGDPVFSKNADDYAEVLLYRHPVKYFSSDKLYMYFDDSARLIYWEYKPYTKTYYKK